MSLRKIPFGLRDGRLFQPDEVSRGLACNCVCPGCGSKLVAHHGDKKVKHFVHYSTAGCANGFESAIHKAAKQALLQSKQILVPPIHASKFLFDRGLNIEVSERQSIAERFIAIEDVEVEKDMGSVVPDLVISGLGKKLFVEIAYTHFVDEEKRSKLKELGIATLEINLSGLSEMPSMSELTRLVVEEPLNRAWIFNSKEIELAQRVESVAKEKLIKAVAREKTKREQYRRWVEQYIKMSDEEKLAVHLKQLGIKRNQLPGYLGIFVRGSNSFSTHPVVWQTAIFTHFVYKKEMDDFSVQKISDWCYQLFKVKRVFPNSEKVAIWDFLKHLESFGFLFYQGSQMFTVMVGELKKPSLDGTKKVAAQRPEDELPF